MEIKNKYIIEVVKDENGKEFDKRWWWNGAKPFVDDIDKAFICPNKKSMEKNCNTIGGFYGYEYRVIPLKIEVE